MTDPRNALADERAELTTRIASLTRDLDDLGESTAEVATDDEHDPDGSGGVAVGRAQLQALLEQARSHLADVDDALARLDAGSYGTCERCAQPIARARLAARPAARLCIDCASAH